MKSAHVSYGIDGKSLLCSERKIMSVSPHMNIITRSLCKEMHYAELDAKVGMILSLEIIIAPGSKPTSCLDLLNKMPHMYR